MIQTWIHLYLLLDLTVTTNLERELTCKMLMSRSLWRGTLFHMIPCSLLSEAGKWSAKELLLWSQTWKPRSFYRYTTFMLDCLSCRYHGYTCQCTHTALSAWDDTLFGNQFAYMFMWHIDWAGIHANHAHTGYSTSRAHVLTFLVDASNEWHYRACCKWSHWEYCLPDTVKVCLYALASIST